MLAELGRGVIGSESVVGPNLTVGAKSSIKKSSVGANCWIGDEVKVVNCVLMDGVTIKAGCALTGVVVRVPSTPCLHFTRQNVLL